MRFGMSFRRGINLDFRRQMMRHLVILTVLVCTAPIWPQGQQFRFSHLDIEDGLSQNSVQCIHQDRQGFMWFGTSDGLNRYDGNTFVILRRDPHDANGLSGNNVQAILEDQEGILWIGTQAGLTRFDPVRMQFVRFTHDSEDSTSLSHNNVQSVYEDREGVIWVGTDEGLNRFDRTSGTFLSYVYDPENPASLSGNDVNRILEDRSGTLWIGTFGGGVCQYNRETGTFIRYQHTADGASGLESNFVRALYEDRDGAIWVGTEDGLYRFDREADRFIRQALSTGKGAGPNTEWVMAVYEDDTGLLWAGTEGDGLYAIDRRDGDVIHFSHNPTDPVSLSDDRIYALFEDASGLLWIGTWNGGVSQLNRKAKPFFHYKHDPDDPASLSGNSIFGVCEDHLGDIWIGTSQGLNRFDRDSGTFTRFLHDPSDPSSISSDVIFAIREDGDGDIWFSTLDGGLNRFDRKTGRFSAYKADPENPHSLSYNTIWTLLIDQAGMIWVGTGGEGLDKFDPETGRFSHYRHDPDDPRSLSGNVISALIEDHSGVLWAGTEAGGLNRYDAASGRFVRFQHNPEDPASLSHNYVSAILEDARGRFWVGTNEGLDRFDRQTETFVNFSEEAGLINNSVYGILEDDRGNLWLSSNKGLSRFDPESVTFRNYTMQDGLQSDEFNAGAYLKLRSGEMLFGGINGFNLFHPDSIRDNMTIPPVVLTDFQLYNRPVSVGQKFDGRTILKQGISVTESITLSYKARVFSLTFAALNYIHPEKNQYRYRLEGFESVWNEVDDRRFATYTNLSPGQYTFRVQGSNNDGIWNREGASLRIRVTPPFWGTWWFRGLLILAFAAVIVGVYQVRTRAIRHRAKELETVVSKRTAELRQTNLDLHNEIKVRQKAESKIKASLREKEVLLKEIHHRVKNNLQVISSLLNLQLPYIHDKQAAGLFKESQDRIRSMALIHEKLYQSPDLARIHFGEYIRTLTKGLFRAYRINPSKVVLDVQIEDVFVGVDCAVPCGLIVNELVSNALKHAFPSDYPGQGRIGIQLQKLDNHEIELVVEDNGVGLPEGFEIQATKSLGMKLVKLLAEDQLQGSLSVEMNRGVTYRVRFPVSETGQSE